MKNIFYVLCGVAIGFAIDSAVSIGQAAPDTMSTTATIKDYTEDVIIRTPYQQKICTEEYIQGDKTGDTLTGAIIGGIIGNNVSKAEGAGAAGAIIGGLIGNQESDAKGGYTTVCQTRTEYEHRIEQRYSHSTVTFTIGDKTHVIKFQR